MTPIRPSYKRRLHSVESNATELVEALLRRGMQAQDIIDNAGLDYDEVAQDVPAMEPDLVQAVLGSVECL